MTEIKAPALDFVDRRLFLHEADRYIKACKNQDAAEGVKHMVRWIVDAVEVPLRYDVRVTKVVGMGGVHCSHCRTTCGERDRFCRNCGGRFV